MRDPDVDRLLADSTHPMTASVRRLRSAVLDGVAGLTEHVKWRSPSFVHGGTDRMTVNMARPDRVVLVLHRGARVRADRADFSFADPSGLLEWRGADRAVVTWTDAQALDDAVPDVVDLLGRWVRA